MNIVFCDNKKNYDKWITDNCLEPKDFKLIQMEKDVRGIIPDYIIYLDNPAKSIFEFSQILSFLTSCGCEVKHVKS